MADKEQAIYSQMSKLDEKRKALQKKLDTMNYDEKFASAKKLEGLYFMQVEKHHKTHFSLAFVYDTDKKDCNSKAMRISYWTDNEDWFNIENYHNFSIRDYDGVKDWNRTTKAIFDKHYEIILARIKKVKASHPKKKKNGKA